MKSDASMIEEKLKRIPRKPGIYLLKNEENAILYVGKAKQLKNRLRSHFQPGKDEDRRHRLMMAKVTGFETIVTDSEVEALILEANYIREHKPRYNVNLKDDKSYPYIRVTADLYPRLFVTRKIVRDGSRYFGPYTDVASMRKLMAAVRRIFPVRTCRLQITAETIAQKKHKVCLNHHIGRCRGPCEGLISLEDYLRTIGQVVSFIQGRGRQLIADLEERMARLSEMRLYEEAARVRNEIRSIDTFHSRQKVVDDALVDRDLVTVAVDGSLGCGMVFHVREGKMTNRQHFHLTGADGREEPELLSSFLKQYYLRTDFIPSQILISRALSETEELEQWLTEKRGKKAELIAPKIGQKARLMAMCDKNARLLLEDMKQQTEGKERLAPSVKALQDDLKLTKPPVRIEAVDISNIQGSDAVASLVVFENGQPRKSEYRKFTIKSVEGADDFASMAEVVARRVSRLLREKKTLPDLFLVDGGKGQLSAAVSVLEKLNVPDQPVIGLAKRLEEVFLPGFSDPQNIPKHSASIRLLQRVRDEAHRFAVTFHRQRRQRRIIHTVLDDIPGIGENRRNALLKAFGSVDGLRKATEEEIQKVPGMNRKVAEQVVKFLKK